MALIALVACCDTKYHELCFAKQKILESGNQVLVIDIATGPDIRFKADITRETVLEIGGHTWEHVHNMAKSDAISAMTESICLNAHAVRWLRSSMFRSIRLKRAFRN